MFHSKNMRKEPYAVVYINSNVQSIFLNILMASMVV